MLDRYPPEVTEVEELAELILQMPREPDRPLIVGLDGHSGAGKSTLATALSTRIESVIVEGDDFYSGGVELRNDSPAERASACIDWSRLRLILERLRAGQDVQWRAFDWTTFDGRLCQSPNKLSAAPFVIVEGVYTARPELADLIDFRVLVDVPADIRAARLLVREGIIGSWELQWHEAEDFYFRSIMPRQRFDAIYRSLEPRPEQYEAK